MFSFVVLLDVSTAAGDQNEQVQLLDEISQTQIHGLDLSDFFPCSKERKAWFIKLPVFHETTQNIIQAVNNCLKLDFQLMFAGKYGSVTQM